MQQLRKKISRTHTKTFFIKNAFLIDLKEKGATAGLNLGQPCFVVSSRVVNITFSLWHNLDLRSSQMVRILKRRNKADGPSFFTNN